MSLLGTLGALNILVSGDTSPFTSAMDKAAFAAEKNLQKIQRNAKVTSAIVGTVLVASFTLLMRKMQDIAQRADDLLKMSKTIGLTAEELSKLKYAGDLAGISMEDLQTAFIKMNKGAYDSLLVFRALGISVKDSSGNMRSSNELFFEIADRFKNMRDGAAKTAIAVDLFGRSGAKMIPLLNEGSEGLKRQGIEAEKLGQVFSTGLAVQSETFNDNMLRLNKTLDGSFVMIANNVIPVLDGLVQKLFDSSEGFKGANEFGKGLARTMVLIVNTGLTLGQMFNTLKDTLIVVGATFSNIPFLSKKPDWYQNAVKGLQGTIDTWVKLGDTIQSNWDLIDKKVDETATITASAAERASASSIDSYSRIREEVENESNKIKSMADGVGNAFSSAFDKAIINGEKFRDVIKSLASDIQSSIIKSLITQPIGAAISSGIKSFFTPSTTSPTTASAKGNVFAFANGGVINRPMVFPMGGGKTGLAGEAGAEAIMPLTRTPSGDLGVKAVSGGRVQVNVYAPEGSSVKEERNQFGDTEQINIMIDEAVASNIGQQNSKTHRTLKNTFGLGQTLNRR